MALPDFIQILSVVTFEESKEAFLINITQLQGNVSHLYFLRCLFLMTGKRRYNIKMWKTFTDCFNCLPVAAIVDEKIFCCHGGDV